MTKLNEAQALIQAAETRLGRKLNKNEFHFRKELEAHPTVKSTSTSYQRQTRTHYFEDGSRIEHTGRGTWKIASSNQ